MITWQTGKVFIAAAVIALSSWFAGKQPRLAGFLMALPIASMLALAFNQTEFGDSAKSVAFAKSIVVAVPLSLLFFVPFLLAERLQWPFWGLYLAGFLLLGVGYGIHSLLAT